MRDTDRLIRLSEEVPQNILIRDLVLEVHMLYARIADMHRLHEIQRVKIDNLLGSHPEHEYFAGEDGRDGDFRSILGVPMSVVDEDESGLTLTTTRNASNHEYEYFDRFRVYDHFDQHEFYVDADYTERHPDGTETITIELKYRNQTK
jgi:hypothetical protein